MYWNSIYRGDSQNSHHFSDVKFSNALKGNGGSNYLLVTFASTNIFSKLYLEMSLSHISNSHQPTFSYGLKTRRSHLTWRMLIQVVAELPLVISAMQLITWWRCAGYAIPARKALLVLERTSLLWNSRKPWYSPILRANFSQLYLCLFDIYKSLIQ